MLRMSESYFRRSHLSVAHDEFIAIGEVVRDQMVASMQGHEHLVRNVFNPLFISISVRVFIMNLYSIRVVRFHNF